MTHRLARSIVIAASAVTVLSPVSGAQSPSALRQVATIALPGVSGRIDHLAFDAARNRLFVAALGNDTVEIVDTASNQRLRSVSGLHEPQGLAIVPEHNAVAVANGDTGTLQLLDVESTQTRWTTRIGGDADNVRYDAGAKRLYVAAEGGLFAVDPASGRVVGRIAISGHPESFQLQTQATRVFANLPGHLQVVAADRKSMDVAARWTLGACAGNYPMALDESTHRLFVGCRNPALLALLDADSGKPITTLPTVGDTDDLFYDGDLRRVYVIGGEGAVDVFDRNGDQLRRVDRVQTRQGARTGLWVPSQRRLYVAVPARGGQPAEVRVLQAEPK
jgi:YVTN family beta-propeller protein